MEIEINLCKKCGKEIPFGTNYYSIVKNLEFIYKESESDEYEINIEESEEVVNLCKTCGSYFNTENLETIIKLLPIPGQEIRN